MECPSIDADGTTCIGGPKGSGHVSFGTFTAGSGSVVGYIEILDASCTQRQLAVLA